MLATAGMAALLAGCGAGGTSPETKNALDESSHCISCHEGIDSNTGKPAFRTPGTGLGVVTEWRLSAHNTNNGAGCSDCHDDGFTHTTIPASCSKCHTITGLSKNPTNNPDRDGKCAKCHDKINPRPGQSDGYTTAVAVPGILTATNTRFVHFSTGRRTSYVSSNNRLHCRNCHNPHDTSSGREQRKQWAESGHGNSRGLARVGIDAKTRGTDIPLDQNFDNRNYCVRCHTSTGFINFVKDDSFTNVNALPDIGADGLPDPNGFRSNFPWGFKTGAAYQSDQKPYVLNTNGTLSTTFRAYKDTSREATNCNVCHLDSRTSSSLLPNEGPRSYSGELRPVALATGVKIYYPYSSTGRGHSQSVTTVQFDTLGNSNLCLTCHSGRATGQTIKGTNTVYQNNLKLNFANNPSAPSIHDFAGGAVLLAEKSAFFFYTSSQKYNIAPAHRSINIDGNGPCISCHMPKVQSSQSGGLIHSHLFRPVTWTNDDINDKITNIISFSSVCSQCHTGTSADFVTTMNNLRRGFRMTVLILKGLRPSSSAWTTQNKNGGLDSSTTNPAIPGLIGPTYTNVNVGPTLGGFPAGAYTMGAQYNEGLFENEPSSYNHNPILVRQLLYDSIDWLKNGWFSATPFGSSPASVYNAINNFPIPAAGLKWNKANPVQGAIEGTNIPVKDYDIFLATERDLVFKYVCKNYVAGSGECKRPDGK